ncbi:hypothetical protein [Methanosarcina barkeri]|uniref:hypothetical protein n=1 Tax=Methanosarcina barkeri TaxID=2208 RepID=UPI0006D29C53|nr:hypothetical protein [Methanosarcina barkeri]
MAEIPSQISFSTLISHTFPGVFASIGIFLMLYTQFSDPISNLFSLLQEKDNIWASFIGAVGSLIFFGTITGIIIDALSHVIIKLLYYNFCPDNQSKVQIENALGSIEELINILMWFLKLALNIIVFVVTLPFYGWAKKISARKLRGRKNVFFQR